MKLLGLLKSADDSIKIVDALTYLRDASTKPIVTSENGSPSIFETTYNGRLLVPKYSREVVKGSRATYKILRLLLQPKHKTLITTCNDEPSDDYDIFLSIDWNRVCVDDTNEIAQFRSRYCYGMIFKESHLHA